jgi:hypothetical protein
MELVIKLDSSVYPYETLIVESDGNPKRGAIFPRYKRGLLPVPVSAVHVAPLGGDVDVGIE